MLESALGRPQNKWSDGERDLAALAAAYAFGVAKNHPFVDGNKRAALLSLVTFLGLNGIALDVDNAEAVVMIQALAAGEVEEEGLARWFRDNWPARPRPPTKGKPERAGKAHARPRSKPAPRPRPKAGRKRPTR
jgi:death-on-curing protein